MKKIVSLILALALTVCLPFAVSAAANSPGHDGPPKFGDTTMIGLWVLVMVLSVVAIVVSTVVYRHNMKNAE